jgi:hypothetical protein
MGVGLKRPSDAVALLLGETQHRFDRAGIDFAGARIVVEHRIDERRLFGGGIGNDVADRIGRLVKERVDCGLSRHGRLLSAIYILVFANLARCDNKKSITLLG